jgi:hypothetical protein
MQNITNILRHNWGADRSRPTGCIQLWNLHSHISTYSQFSVSCSTMFKTRMFHIYWASSNLVFNLSTVQPLALYPQMSSSGPPISLKSKSTNVDHSVCILGSSEKYISLLKSLQTALSHMGVRMSSPNPSGILAISKILSCRMSGRSPNVFGSDARLANAFLNSATEPSCGYPRRRFFPVSIIRTTTNQPTMAPIEQVPHTESTICTIFHKIQKRTSTMDIGRLPLQELPP